MNTWLLPVIIALPLLGAALLAGLGKYLPRPAIAAFAAGTVFVSFALTVAALVQLTGLAGGGVLTTPLWSWNVGRGSIDLGLLGDQISLWWALVITGVGFLIHLYSAGYMADEKDMLRYFAKLNYFIFAMSLLVLSDNFLGMMIGWANVGLASWMLIGFYRHEAAAAAAAKAFLLNVIGEFGLIMAAILLFWQFGSLRFDVVFAGAAAMPAGVATAVGLFLLMGAVAKSAQLPLHTWLPDAMQGPTPVSALIHAATMVTAGVYLVARAHPIYAVSDTAMGAVAVVGASAALFGAIIAVGQNDIKKVLAFSTMSQIGYMLLAAGVGAYAAALFHFLTHAFFKALLFLVAGMVIHGLHGEQDIRRMGGLGKKMPFAYWTFLIGALALAGLPPLSGFFSKDEILGEVLAGGHYVLWAMATVAAALTAFYIFRLFSLVFAGDPYDAAAGKKKRKRAHADHGHHDDHAHHEPLTMKAPVAVLAVLSVAGGWIGIPGVVHLQIDFLAPAFARFGDGLHPHAVKLWPILLAIVVAAAGSYTGIRLFGPGGSRRAEALRLAGRPGPLAQGLYFDTIYHHLFVLPARALADWVYHVGDAGMVDGIVGGLARLSDRLGGWLSAVHTGFVRRYALSLFAGLALTVIYFVFFV